jgi:hypothetical protein
VAMQKNPAKVGGCRKLFLMAWFPGYRFSILMASGGRDNFFDNDLYSSQGPQHEIVF